MNFKDWAKLDEDEKSCVLVHPSGHKMTIAKKALPRIQQEALGRLKFAEGGKIQGISQQGRDVRFAHKLKGSKEREEDRQESLDYAKEEAKGRADFERKAVKPKLKGLADGGEVSQDQSVQADPTQPGQTPITINVGTPQPQAGQVVPVASQVAPVSPPVQAPPQAVAPPPKPAPNPAAEYGAQANDVEAPNIQQGRPVLNANGQPNPSAIVENAVTAEGNQQNIEAAKAKAAAQNEAGYLQGIAKNQQIAQERYNNLEQHTNETAQAIQKGLINPKAYQESMGSGQKVSTAIGLALGGFGTAFGGHNYAMDFLNKQIDRDIDAQKARSEQQKTILGAYQHLYGEGVQANNATKVTMLDLYSHKINETALKLGTPQAITNAQKMQNQIAIDKMKLLREGATPLNVLPGNNPNSSNLPAKRKSDGPIAKKEPHDEDRILVKGADEIGKALQYNPQATPYLGAIQEQKAKADLADKALDEIKEKFPKLVENRGTMGQGYLRRKGHLLGKIPYVGPLVEGATNYATDTNQNSAYESDYSSVVGALRGALQGNVSDDLLDSTIDKNMPEQNDPPELLKKKLDTLKSFIKSHTKTDLLRTYGLSKK